MNYENKIVLLSAKAYFSTRQKTNAHEELPHRTIATHHHCHYLRYTFRKFPTGFAGTAVRNINPEKPDVPLNKNDAFQKVQKRRVQEKR